MEVLIEVGEFIRQVVCVRNDLEVLLAKALLHLDDINTESILASELLGHREVVDLLVVVHVVVDVALEGLRRPEQVPIMCLSGLPSVCLEDSPDKLRLALVELEVHFASIVRRIGVLVVKYSSFLKIQRTLSITYEYRRIFQGLEADELVLETILYVDHLLLGGTHAIILK